MCAWKSCCNSLRDRSVMGLMATRWRDTGEVASSTRRVPCASTVKGGIWSAGRRGWEYRVALVLLSVLVCVVMAQSVNGEFLKDCRVDSHYVRPPKGPIIGKKIIKVLKKEKKGDEATQVHISMNGPNHMHISWITKKFGNPSTVEYGTSSGQYTASSTGKTTSYCYVLYKSGEIHDVVIGPLEDATTYYYRLGGGTKEYIMKTPPGPGAEVPITFSVIGDLGQTSWTKITLDHMEATQYDMLLYPGDLSYADYYQPLWDSFGELVAPLASAKPWMVTEGNHEKEVIPLIIESFRAYNARWSMPFAESGSPSNLYYSFEVAGCHILMLGSYADYSSKSDQYKWLKADLAKVDRSKTPWLIAVLHAPWYNSNTAHQGDGDGMMKSIEPLLYDAKTDIIFAGHVHAYERTTRVYKGVPDPLGIIHINIGDGGNREGLASTYISPQPVWSVYREASFGFGQLKIINSTTAHWEWHRNEDTREKLKDEVDIIALSDPNNPTYKIAAELSGKPLTSIRLLDEAQLGITRNPRDAKLAAAMSQNS